MFKHYVQLFILILAVSLITSCNAAPQSTIQPTEMQPTVIPTEPVPVNESETDKITETPDLLNSTEVEEKVTTNETSNNLETNIMIIKIGNEVLTATLVDNSSTAALKEKLAEGPISIEMSDYGSMEKVGGFGFTLPRNDEQITTEAGDLILYQGGAFVIYYAPNSWNFTRLGKIDNITAQELKKVLGNGNVTVTLELKK